MKKLITALMLTTLTSSAFASEISCFRKYKASTDRAVKQSNYVNLAKNVGIAYSILDPIGAISTVAVTGGTALAIGTTTAATIATPAITAAAAALSISPTLFLTATATVTTLGTSVAVLAPIVAPLAPVYILLNQKGKIQRKGVEFENYGGRLMSSLEQSIRAIIWAANKEDGQKTPVFLKDVLDLYVTQEMKDNNFKSQLKGLSGKLQRDLISDEYGRVAEAAIEKMKANILDGVSSNKFCQGSDVARIKGIKRHLVNSLK